MKTFGRRTLAAVLSVIMFLSCFAGLTFSVGAETSGDFEYEVLDDGTVSITKYKGNDTNVEIPSVIDGKKVTELYHIYTNNRFSGIFPEPDKITSVVIPNSVNKINPWAFYGCSNLKSITIPNSVTYIGSFVFCECNGLTSITIPDSVTELGGAFSRCKNLKEIIVSENNKNYKTSEGVLFNKDMTEIVLYPPCRQGSEYTIPNGVIWIGAFSFDGCSKLTNINIPNSVTYIEYSSFERCDGLTNITIPHGVEHIHEMAFTNCTNLVNIEISDSVNDIGANIFSGCSNLKSIDVSENNEYYKSVDGILFDKDMTELIAYPNGRKGAYCIPDGIEVIDMFAFCNSLYLTNITIPDSVKTIFSDFRFCYNLKSASIAKKVSDISGHKFGYTYNDNGDYDKVLDFIIYGYPNTQAEEYAKENGFEFIDISSCKHTETELENRKEATCTESGYSGDEHCKNCTMLIKNGAEIPALGHSEETIKGKPATCTETGLTDGIKCSVCGEIIKAQEEIPAVGHTFDNGVCTACGAIDPDYKVVLNSLNEQIKVDNESKSVSMALAKTSGMKVSEFKKQFDGEISVDIDDNSLVSNGTKFKFGGNEFTVIVKGDVQADGKITASDARMVLRIAARLESVDANAFGAADINGDGKVSPSEARKVLRFVARLENTIE